MSEASGVVHMRARVSIAFDLEVGVVTPSEGHDLSVVFAGLPRRLQLVLYGLRELTDRQEIDNLKIKWEPATQ
jgi:hypothetical protein